MSGLVAPVSIGLYAIAILLPVEPSLQLLLMFVNGSEVVAQLEVARWLTILASRVGNPCRAQSDCINSRKAQLDLTDYPHVTRSLAAVAVLKAK